MENNPSKDKKVLRRGAWSPEEDQKLVAYIARFGIWNWNQLPKHAGLTRTGKSCRLRWLNYLRPGIKRGNITREEEEIISKLHRIMGNRWAAIAAKLPQRTDNEIKNYYNTRMKKRPRRKEGDVASMSEPPAESKNQINHPDITNSSSTMEESPSPVSYDLPHFSSSSDCQAVGTERTVNEEEYKNVGSLFDACYNNYEVLQTLPAESSNIDSYSRLDDSFDVPFDDFFWATSSF